MNFGKKIRNVVKGDTRTFLDTDFANEVIDSINSLLRFQIRQGDKDSIDYSSENVILTLADKSSGEGLPEGYEPMDVVICQNGSPMYKTILAKDTF